MNNTTKLDERMNDDNVKAKNSATDVKVPYGLKHQEECPICFDDPRPKQISRCILPCGHMICGVCLYLTVEDACYNTGANFSCPLCREEFNG
jgi:hypothetical protein